MVWTYWEPMAQLKLLLYHHFLRQQLTVREILAKVIKEELHVLKQLLH